MRVAIAQCPRQRPVLPSLLCQVLLSLVCARPARAETPQLELDSGGHRAPLTAYARGARGLIVTTSEDGTARLWESDRSPRLVLRPPLRRGETLSAAAVSPAEGALALGTDQGAIFVYHADTGLLRRRAVGTSAARALAFVDEELLRVRDASGARALNLKDGSLRDSAPDSAAPAAAPATPAELAPFQALPTFSASGVDLDPTGARLRLRFPDGRAVLYAAAEHTLTSTATFTAPAAPCEALGPGGEPLRVTSAGNDLIASDRASAPRWRQPLPAAARVLRCSADRQLLLGALVDGTLRWFRGSDGAPLLTLFPHPDGRRWVAFTPSGYYDASFGGDELLGFRVDHSDRDADFFRASRLRDVFYRPDIIARVLVSQDETRAVREANALSGRAPLQLPLRELLPPVLRIISPRDNGGFRGASVDVCVAARSLTGAPVRLQSQTRGGDSGERGAGGPCRAEPGEEALTLRVPLSPRNTVITLAARTERSATEVAFLRLRYAGPPPPPTPPRLFILAVGVGTYRDPRLLLRYPASDARALVAALAAQRGRQYPEVSDIILTDASATAPAIRAALRRLREQARPTDVSAIFLAGHGINDREQGRYHFLPYEAESERLETLISAEELQREVGAIAGRVLLFLDTCHSGNIGGLWRLPAPVDLARLTSELASEGNEVVVFAASSGSQTSRESPDWKHGAFTLALCEGLRGAADFRGQGTITLGRLEDYISTRVRGLTFEQQTPTVARPRSVPNFVIGTVTVPTPLHRRWWLWTGVAAAAGVIAGVSGWAATRPQVVDFTR